MKNRKKVIESDGVLSHEEMKEIMLKNENIRLEYERLNREEFVLLDEILAARKKACLLKTEI